MALHVQAIPSSEEVRETLLDRIYYPYKKQILIGGALAAVAIVSVLAVREVRHRRIEDQWTRRAAAIEAGMATSADPEAQRQAAGRQIDLLQALLRDYPDDPVTPWALTALFQAQVQAERWDDALATLETLRTAHKDAVLVTESADASETGSPRTLADRAEATIRSQKQWAAASKYEHPAPSTQRRAYIETTAGNFWIGFYEEQAPQHVANFLADAKSGYFNATQVYHVRTGGSTPEEATPLLFEAGSAASKFGSPDWAPNPAQHDRDEPTATQETEDARYSVRHLKGIVSSVEMPSGESAHRFMVIAAENGISRYDGQNTPFAAVLDTEDSFGAVNRICRTPTYGTDPSTKDDPEATGMRDHPYPPVWIRRVSIWTPDNKLDEGHTWDTSRAGKGEPEPWEATLPAPPRPSDFAPKPHEPKKDDSPPKEPPPGGQGGK